MPSFEKFISDNVKLSGRKTNENLKELKDLF